MKVLVLGSGGRESALAWALARSPSVDGVISAPGNPGMASLGESFSVDVEGPDAALELARRTAPDLVVVGPEAPLVSGVGDALREEGFAVFGPGADAALIEGSKSHAKRLMRAAGIPTAAAVRCSSTEEAVAALERFGAPYVIKADGLAAGKGVVVTSDRDEAVTAIEESITHGRFGNAGRRLLVEEFLDGEEASLIAFSDGRAVVPCEPAQDYKRAFDADEGPNTGGMGSYSPVPACPPDLALHITKEILEPMIAETATRGAPFVGALYAGLALTSSGPKVIEFNARFGDPETQALLPRLESDLGEVCLAAATGELSGTELKWSPQSCVTVVLASRGYPGGFDKGLEITGTERVEDMEDVYVFHAGTARRNGSLVTAGGRVLAVSALGDGVRAARRKAYEATAAIGFEGKHNRTDIARRAEESESAHG
jgi:phosphoribosylamine--glycine ligase